MMNILHNIIKLNQTAVKGLLFKEKKMYYNKYIIIYERDYFL